MYVCVCVCVCVDVYVFESMLMHAYEYACLFVSVHMPACVGASIYT